FAIDRAPDEERSPQWWARAVMESLPAALRVLIFARWRWERRLSLAPASDVAAVVGWTLVPAGSRGAVLRVDSPLIEPRVVVEVHEGTVVCTTLVRYLGRRGRIVWTLAAQIHRR